MTLSLNCTRIFEVMTRPLPFSPLSPLGPTLTRFIPTLKDSDEEVESPHILGLGSAAFGGSSSSGKNGATKSVEGDESSGHERTEGHKGQDTTIETEVAEATQITGKDMEELGFFTSQVSGSELSEKEVSELGNKGKYLGYVPRSLLFDGED